MYIALKHPAIGILKWNAFFIEINWIYLKRNVLLWIRTWIIFCLVVAFQIFKTTNFFYQLIVSRTQSCSGMKTTCLSLFYFHKRVVGVILKIKLARIALIRLNFAQIIFRFYGFWHFHKVLQILVSPILIRAKILWQCKTWSKWNIKKNLRKMKLEKTKLTTLIFAIFAMFFSQNNKTKKSNI